LYVSSAHVYGNAQTDEPLIDEARPLKPIGPYGESKAAADIASEEYWSRDKLEIVRVRPFNHIGPRQLPDFAVPRFARQIAAIERGLQQNPMTVGNCASRRDFTDVRDMVGAYCLLMEHGRPGEAYNVGTGEAHSIQSILDRLLAMARVNVEVEQDPKLIRPSDAAALRADATKLRRQTGWTPRFPLSQTLGDILEFWRSVVARAG
jgi:GDP-4-dehydro-6-deoxy-D-mannose reductase